MVKYPVFQEFAVGRMEAQGWLLTGSERVGKLKYLARHAQLLRLFRILSFLVAPALGITALVLLRFSTESYSNVVALAGLVVLVTALALTVFEERCAIRAEHLLSAVEYNTFLRINSWPNARLVTVFGLEKNSDLSEEALSSLRQLASEVSRSPTHQLAALSQASQYRSELGEEHFAPLWAELRANVAANLHEAQQKVGELTQMLNSIDHHHRKE